MPRKFYSVISLFLSLLFQTTFESQVDSSENFTENLESSDISNGFGDSFSWYSFEEGLSKAHNEEKPLMIIIHKPNCIACKTLKEKFSTSEEILKLSKNFIMVNIKEQDIIDEDLFSADGVYVPRIFFLDKSGNVQLGIYNRNGNSKYKFFYHDMSHVAKSMKEAISKLLTFRTYKEL